MKNVILGIVGLFIALWGGGLVLGAIARVARSLNDAARSTGAATAPTLVSFRESVGLISPFGRLILLVGLVAMVSLIAGVQWGSMSLDGVVVEIPLLGWLIAGFVVGLAVSAAIKVVVLEWPNVASVPRRIPDLEHLRAGVETAGRHFRMRVVLAVPLVLAAAILVSASAVLGRGYPWRGAIDEKVAALDPESGKGETRRHAIVATAALNEAMRTISADQSIDAAPLHIEGLSLLRKLAEPNPGAGIVGQRVAARASALLDAYRQETERSIGTRRAEARTRAAALTKIGDARGHYWLGQAYDFGVGGGRDLTAAYEEYSSAVRLGVSEAEKTREQLVKKMLVADQRAKDVAYRHLESQAQAGDSNAQVWLGYRYKNGDGIEKDLERARYWYERAAGQDANWPAKKQALLALQDLEKARHTNQKTK